MTTAKLFSLADLVKVTGLKRRTVQVWTEAGVIKAEPQTNQAGTGTHKKFSVHEARIACLLVPLTSLRLPVSMLWYFADQSRVNIERGVEFAIPQHSFFNRDTLYSEAGPHLAKLYELDQLVANLSV